MTMGWLALLRRGFVAAGVVACLGILILGKPLINAGGGLVVALVPGASLILFFVGLRIHRPDHMGAWRILGASLTFHVLAAAAWLHFVRVALGLQLLGYAGTIVAILVILRSIGGTHRREALIDAGVALVGAVVLLTEVRAALDNLPAIEALFVVIDVVTIGLVSRLQTTLHRPAPSLRYIYAALIVTMIMDVELLLGSPSALSAAAPSLTFSLVAAAALHPSVVEVTRVRSDPMTQVQPFRVLALGLFLVACNVVVGASAADVGGWRSIVVMLGPALLSALLVSRLLSSLRDHAEARALLARRAHHDGLTGLANRAAITEAIDRALALDRRPERTGVLFCDLDGFKAVNDSFGHKVGDALLVLTAERLRTQVRPGDTVGRLGGDEFVVACFDVDPGELAALGGRVTAALAEPAELLGHRIRPAASVGAATAVPGMNVDDLLHTADAAMYGNKHRSVTGPRPGLRHRGEQGIAGAFRRGLDRDEVAAWFQPVRTASDGTLIGAEALVRWDDPSHGIRPPGDFLPQLVDGATSDELDLRMLDLALSAVPDGQFVSVNIAPEQLRPVLIDRVKRTLEAHEVNPARLMLEITESSGLEASTMLVETVGRLRSHGVRLALDDFGTGASSLDHLSWLEVDCLKIDAAFVAPLHAHVATARRAALAGRAVVEGTITMAHRLGITVVAEGVEHPDQLRELALLGCDAAQGFWLGPPAPHWPDPVWNAPLRATPQGA